MNHSMISRYRVQLMGFATIWVAFLHASMWFSDPVLATFKKTGHGGVDIFLFLSSFGLYYAWQKGERGKEFFFRRFIRIFPAFLIVALFRAWYQNYTLVQSLQLITTVAFWIGYDRSMWYISGIVVLYAFSPLYLKWFCRGKQELKTGISIIISILFGLLFHGSNQMIFFARIPVFILGFLAGKYAYEKKPIHKKEVLTAAVFFLIGIVMLYISYCLDQDELLLYGWGMYWYPNLFTTWFLCLFLSWLAEKMEKHLSAVNRFFGQVGAVSLEFYLLHELMIEFWANIFMIQPRYSYHGILYNLSVLVLTWCFSKALHWAAGLAIRKIEGTSHERV